MTGIVFSESICQLILSATQAEGLVVQECIQPMWKGYGKVLRIGLKNTKHPTCVVKYLQPPEPAGLSMDRRRKMKSYLVEANFYQYFGPLCDDLSRVPHCLKVEIQEPEKILVLEDLASAGFTKRMESPIGYKHLFLCVKWLASFHARFLVSREESSKEYQQLWETGTFWHLKTRHEELRNMSPRSVLKKYAQAIDKKLSTCKYLTLVHGDAKVANFCFQDDDSAVAAVDFQYVGKGCGMKDVAYLLYSSSLGGLCIEESVLEEYFETLMVGLTLHNPTMTLTERLELKREWEEMYYVAWADLHRFLEGWHPAYRPDNYQRTCVLQGLNSIEEFVKNSQLRKKRSSSFSYLRT